MSTEGQHPVEPPRTPRPRVTRGTIACIASLLPATPGQQRANGASPSAPQARSRRAAAPKPGSLSETTLSAPSKAATPTMIPGAGPPAPTLLGETPSTHATEAALCDLTVDSEGTDTDNDAGAEPQEAAGTPAPIGGPPPAAAAPAVEPLAETAPAPKAKRGRAKKGEGAARAPRGRSASAGRTPPAAGRGAAARASAQEAGVPKEAPAGKDDADPWQSKEDYAALDAEIDPAEADESLVVSSFAEKREPPPVLVMPLLPYQKEFLAWAIQQELGPMRGGILADEMGMGKTIQAVCVIVTHPREGCVLGPEQPDVPSPGVPSPSPPPRPKLKLRLPPSANPEPSAAQPASPTSSAQRPAASAAAAPDNTNNNLHTPSAKPASAQGDDGSAPMATPPPLPTVQGNADAATPAQPDTGGTDPSPGAKTKSGKAKKPRQDPMRLAFEQAKECRADVPDGGGEYCGATLVVCPVVAAMQWRQEIARYTALGALKVVLYHGSNRGTAFTREQLESADVVLTTYSTIEVDYRKNVMAPKATCTYCNRKFQPERLKVHLRYFCGPYAQKTDKQALQQKKRRGMWGYMYGKKKDDKGKKASDGTETEEPAAKRRAKAPTKNAAKRKPAKGAACNDMDDDDDDFINDGDPDDNAANDSDTDDDDVPAKKKPVRASTSHAGKAPSKKASKRKAADSDMDTDDDHFIADGAAGDNTAPRIDADDDDDDGAAPAKKLPAASAAKAGKAKTARVRGGAEGDDEGGVACEGEAGCKSSARQTTASRSAAISEAWERAGAAAAKVMAKGGSARGASKTPKQPAGGRKRARPAAASSKRPKAAKGQKKRPSGGSDDSGSDWAADRTSSDDNDDDEDESSATDVDSLDDEDDDAAAARPSTSAAARKPNRIVDDDEDDDEDEDLDDDALDAKADAEALEMIALANAQRAKQEDTTSVLHEIRWRRIILDEAHSIKDRRCNTAQSAFALQARYRWALSGTPLQNRVTELYSLVRFLRIYPYSHYFADKTKCCSLDFPFKNDVRSCDLCNGSRMSHYCWWNRRIANPIKFNGYEGRGKTAMLILKHQILPRILLRRTKLQCADDLALPPRRVVLRKDAFDEREADFYEALYTQSQAQFSSYVQSGTILNNYAHIFDLLIRLRQAVNHPYLVVYSASGGRNDNDGSTAAEEPAAPLGVCGICHDPLEDGISAACSHAFCRVCVNEYLDNSVGACKCPVCTRPLTIDLAGPSVTAGAHPASGGAARGAPAGAPKPPLRIKKSSILSRIKAGCFQSSTKVEALRMEVDRAIAEDASAKCIVFSQFTSMLDIVQFRLQQVGIQCVKLEGSMSLDVRARMIASFNNDPSVKVFLMSLKAGGVALNLTVASHVMLMDPWWNPAVEQQAADRIHRLGQFKPITVTRFVIGGTIEERILKLQEKKQLVFEGTVGKDSEALGKLTSDDLKFLFS